MLCYNEIMAVIEPNTEIYLLKSPIEPDNDNQLSFANATAQHTYFSGLPKVTLENATFQRKDGYIRWPASMESVLSYNYCMYRNKSYGNKWFYAFITDIQWLSNDSCGITIKTDVWQTWQFDITFKKCFVEREHVNSDVIGEHTMPEGLDLGEYVENDGLDHIEASPANNTYICMQISTGHVEKDSYYMNIPGTVVVSGLAQGCHLIALPYTTAGLADMYSIIGLFDGFGQAEAIVSIFLIPATCSTWTTGTISGTTGGGSISVGVYIPVESFSAKSSDVTGVPQIGATLNGYTPKNNKMFTYPYNYLYLSNECGADVVFHYEDFIGNTPSFKLYSTLEQGGSMFIVPTNSKKFVHTGTGNCWPEGISLGKLPQLSWTSNYYLNWVAQNATNVKIQTMLTGLQWAGGVLGSMTGQQGIGSGTMSLASSIANTMQQIREAKMTPDQAHGNTNAGSIAYSAQKIGYIFCRMSVRYEYAKAIDDYLTQFGYKVNSLKVPNITGRTYWNYVKTHGCNITGNVPQSDIEELKGLFNRGITIWHDSTKFLDYSQNNTIVTP